jgi:hypothetical protein
MEGRKIATKKMKGAKQIATASGNNLVVSRVKNNRVDTKKPRINIRELGPNIRGFGGFIRPRMQTAGATTSVIAHNQA